MPTVIIRRICGGYEIDFHRYYYYTKREVKRLYRESHGLKRVHWIEL